jgi:hypothetical protein
MGSFLYPIETRGPVTVPGAVTPEVSIRGPLGPPITAVLTLHLSATFHASFALCVQNNEKRKSLHVTEPRIRNLYRAPTPLYSPQYEHPVLLPAEYTT